jgi:hypothetical protein
MQGIFQMFSRSDFPIYHIEGVPVVSSRRGAAEYFFLKGLSWYHRSPGKRRPEFPSWSWAGWTGQLVDKFMYFDQPRINNITKVYLETKNKELEDFPLTETIEGWQEFMSKLASIRVNTIRIHGYTLRCKVLLTIDRGSGGRKNSLTPEDGCILQFEVEDNISVFLAPKWDLEGSQLVGKVLTCVCLEDFPRGGVPQLFTMLLVKEYTHGLAERVGCCSFESLKAQWMENGWIHGQQVTGASLSRR